MAAEGSRLGFAIVAGSRNGDGALGPRLETLGYDALWANDRPGLSGLETLARCAAEARGLELGVGVVALSNRTADSIAAEVSARSLPRDRLVVGVGSGGSRSLALVRAGVEGLRRLLPGVAIAVAALGPGMCRLGGEIGDVVLLNWVLPERIVESKGWIAEGAASAGRPAPRVASYIRVAIGPGAEERLRAEQERYLGRAPQYHAALGHQEGLVGISAPNGTGIGDALGPYREVLDETIVRGLPGGDSIEEWLAIAEAAVR